jgi:hypothetical protein
VKLIPTDGHHADEAGRCNIAYLIDGQRFEAGTQRFADAVAMAHATHQRPRCLCLAEGVEMYVARLAGSNESYIVILARRPSSVAGFTHQPRPVRA